MKNPSSLKVEFSVSRNDQDRHSTDCSQAYKQNKLATSQIWIGSHRSKRRLLAIQIWSVVFDTLNPIYVSSKCMDALNMGVRNACSAMLKAASPWSIDIISVFGLFKSMESNASSQFESRHALHVTYLYLKGFFGSFKFVSAHRTALRKAVQHWGSKFSLYHPVLNILQLYRNFVLIHYR